MKNHIMDMRKIDEEKRRELIPFLYDENYFEKVIQEINLKVVGENDTIKAIFLCSCGMLVVNNQIASFNLLVNDESGVGKDFVTDSTLSIWHKGAVEKRTRISPTAFTYWKQITKKQKDMGVPEWNWNGKVVYLEDISNTILNSDVFKVMCSSGSHATIVKDQKAVDIKVNGKPVMIITSASANPNPELLRRFSIVNLDASENQTKAIIKKQAEMASKGLSISYNHDISTSLSYLERYSVVIPFANVLSGIVPVGIVMRTHFQRFLDYIKASCCFYQYQRDMDENGYLVAIKQDYEIARQVLNKTTSNSKMVSLTKNQQKLIDIFSKLGNELNYSVSDLEPKVTFLGDRQLRRELDKLTDMGFLHKDKEDRAESRKPVIVYSLLQQVEINIPTWEELQKHDTYDK